MAGRGSTAGPAALVAAALLLLLSTPAAAAISSSRYPPLAPGLSLDFYKKSCPKAESIVRDFLRSAVKQNVGLAAALIRLHFHDCFVQGCDASILLDKQPSEQEAVPNQTLRPAAFKAINDLCDRLDRACGGRVVSCADILTLAARATPWPWPAARPTRCPSAGATAWHPRRRTPSSPRSRRRAPTSPRS